MSIKGSFSKIKNFVKKNPLEFWLLVAFLVVGGVFRIYKIDQYMTFLGDEGRDVIIVRRIFTEGHPPLIGPGTSVGSMYLGPLYYYLMAIPLLLAGFSPVGPSVMVAVLSLATVVFIWWIGRSWFGKTAGLIASGLYAVSPTVITFSRSSWNPNIMPFFALLSVYSVWKVWRKNEFGWLIVLGISFAFVLQSHYLGLLLAPTIFLFWILTIRNLKDKRAFIRKSLLGLFIFLLLMSPLLIFDLRHNFMNTKAFYNFIVNRDTALSGNIWTAISKVPQIFNFVNTRLISGKNVLAGIISSVIIAAGVVYLFVKNFVKHRNIKLKPEYWLIFFWLAFGLIGLAAYKMEIYDHYLGFIFPVPFLLFGALISKIFEHSKAGKVFALLLTAYLTALCLVQNPFKYQPNNQLKRAKDVAVRIVELSDKKPFNFAVIAERNYEDGYKYFLDLLGANAYNADTRDPSTITDTLFVVCENEPSTCDPTHSPKAQVANFGMSKIDGLWNIDGVIIYKLSHTK